MNPSDGANLNGTLEQQAEAREQKVKERLAAKSLYMSPEAAPLLADLDKFLTAQIQGCKDRAATTDNKVIEDRHLHMLLMASIIKEYIDNQKK